jgi:hypothetical protein
MNQQKKLLDCACFSVKLRVSFHIVTRKGNIMKTTLLSVVVAVSSMQCNAINLVVKQLINTSIDDNKHITEPLHQLMVATSLIDASYYPPLDEAASKIQKNWFLPNWDYETAKLKTGTLTHDSPLFDALFTQEAGDATAQADLVIAGGAGLGSSIKMLESVVKACKENGARKVVFAVSYRPVRNAAVQRSTVDDYTRALSIVNREMRSAITERTKPSNNETLLKFLINHTSYADDFNGIDIKIIDLADFKEWNEQQIGKVNVVACSPYPQLNHQTMSFAQYMSPTKFNFVRALTVGDIPALDAFDGLVSDHAKLNFKLDMVARNLFKAHAYLRDIPINYQNK